MKYIMLVAGLIMFLGCSNSCQDCQACAPCVPNPDFNKDSVVNGSDAMLIGIAVRDGVYDSAYDMNCDGAVDQLDVDLYVEYQANR